MSYLADPASTSTYGIVKIGNFIHVADGVVSLPQSIETTASVTFNSANVNELYDNSKRVITEVTPHAGTGIAITSLVSTGTTVSFTVTNIGVTSLTAGSGISLTTTTGHITISSFGADLINVTGVITNYTATLEDEYIGVSSVPAVTITLPAGVDGRVYTIKDEYGQGSGKITIQPPVGVLIDNKTNYVISVPNQSISVVYRVGGWWII